MARPVLKDEREAAGRQKLTGAFALRLPSMIGAPRFHRFLSESTERAREGDLPGGRPESGSDSWRFKSCHVMMVLDDKPGFLYEMRFLSGLRPRPPKEDDHGKSPYL